MRQAFAWSLVVFVLFASLLVFPPVAGAGDPDIPQASLHAHRGGDHARAATAAGMARMDQRNDSQTAVLDVATTSKPVSMLEMVARWMIFQAVRAGH